MWKVSVFVGKIVRKITRIRGGGSALPGLVVEKMDRGFLRKVLAKLPRGVVVVSGTNGKTTTTKILSELLEKQGLRVFTNKTGSNFVRGVISAVLEDISWTGKFPYDIAVLELDEAHAVKFAEVVPVDYMLVLNVQRDQLDRFGEIDHTAELLAKVAAGSRKAVLLNREDARVVKMKGKKVKYFGLSLKMRRKFPNDDELLDEKGVVEKVIQKVKTGVVRKLTEKKAEVVLADLAGAEAVYEVGGKKYECKLKLRGEYNAFNAAGAVAVAREVCPEVAAEKWMEDLAEVKSAFGRGEVFEVGGTEVELFLVKNPAAFQQSLSSFAEEGYDYMIAINDKIADGRDVSWLYNVDFTGMPEVACVSGIRASDMALRLKYDEVKVGCVEEDLEVAVKGFLEGEGRKRIFATYTAMLAVRKIIAGSAIL